MSADTPPEMSPAVRDALVTYYGWEFVRPAVLDDALAAMGVSAERMAAILAPYQQRIATLEMENQTLRLRAAYFRTPLLPTRCRPAEEGA